MPVGKQKRKPKDAKSLKKKLDEKAKLGDDKAICRLVQEDVSTRYYISWTLLIITSSLGWAEVQNITIHL